MSSLRPSTMPGTIVVLLQRCLVRLLPWMPFRPRAGCHGLVQGTSCQREADGKRRREAGARVKAALGHSKCKSGFSYVYASLSTTFLDFQLTLLTPLQRRLPALPCIETREVDRILPTSTLAGSTRSMPGLSLAQRRMNAPHSLGPVPSFQLQTPNRSIRRILSTDSLDTLASRATQDTLPEYDIGQEDDNTDVITTSIEVDPDEEDDLEMTPRPSVFLATKHREASRKRSGLAKLFARGNLFQPLPSPGVRMTQLPTMLKTRAKDARHGFSLNLPDNDGAPVLEVDPTLWMNTISRVNVLLCNGQTKEVQALLESVEALRDRVSFVKLSWAKANGCLALDAPDTILLRPTHSTSPSLLTVPELNPAFEDSDDDGSSFTSGRRGSNASSCSSVSTRSSLGQRIRGRLEKREEWCLMFE